MEKQDETQFIVSYLVQTWRELAEYLLANPEKLTSVQLNYWQSYFNLCHEFSNLKMPNESITDYIDKRFQHKDWQDNLIFNFIQRSYQLLSQQTDHLSKELDLKNEKMVKKFQFYSRQFIDSVSPSNFIAMNPEILSKTLETNGANLIEGFKQFQADLERGKGQFQIKLTDLDQFELGKNIAITPGKVIYQNELIELIQYTATTEKVYEYPLLIIPPWINKYYILDLQAENSFVKWFVDQGYTVFMISWVNPSANHSNKTFSDYLFEGPIAALEIIKKVTLNKKINMLGYCIGGTLLGCLLAYLAQKKQDIEILSATFLTTLFDFSEPGEMGAFIDEKQITLLEEHMRKKGYLEGTIMASVFNALRANDLIWSAFINNYLKGQRPKPFDLLYWNADSTNVPAPVHTFYLRNMYLNNLLIQPGKIKMRGVPLDLSKITTPCYFLATRDDHIAPWQSCYMSKDYVSSKLKFVLALSGHVAGIVNPPCKKKYGYWTNKTMHKEAEKFLATATFHEGSWWEDWNRWLKAYSGKLQLADALHTDPKDVIEKAPGSYVKMRLADIAKNEANSNISSEI